MHDQVGVGVGDGREHVEEQADARLDPEALRVAVAVDLLALDVLQHEIGLTRRRDARIDEMRDVSVGEPGQDAALALESFLAGSADQARVQQLDRRQPLEPAVAAPRQPDAAHAALADERIQGVGTDPLTG